MWDARPLQYGLGDPRWNHRRTGIDDAHPSRQRNGVRTTGSASSRERLFPLLVYQPRRHPGPLRHASRFRRFATGRAGKDHSDAELGGSSRRRSDLVQQPIRSNRPRPRFSGNPTGSRLYFHRDASGVFPWEGNAAPLTQPFEHIRVSLRAHGHTRALFQLKPNKENRNVNEPMAGDSVHAGPPWIQPEIQQRIRWRDGDIVISVPPKSGTTWTMNIIHQLLTGGTADFRDIYEEVPWIEFVSHPGQPYQAVLDRVEAMPADTRRAFKTHSAPPGVPFFDVGSGRDVKYIVVFRNPEEALVSFWPFLDQHTDEWYDIWQVPREAMCRPDFPSFYSEVIDDQGMQGMFFEFLAAWWPLRNQENVLFLHFSDMKRDHAAAITKIAQFLDLEPTAERWETILEYTSFPWMKRHQDKFEARTAGKVPILKTGAMIRKGEVGKAKHDGMTDDIAQHLRQVGDRICPDASAINWYYDGGDVP